MDNINIHPRSKIVNRAKHDLRKKITEWFKETPELTDAEELIIITDTFIGLIYGAAKTKIEEERKSDGA